MGSAELRQQLSTTLGSTLDENGSLRLAASGGPLAHMVRLIPVEAEFADLDGVIVHVLLHVVNGRLHELEIYREDSGEVLRPASQAEGLSFMVL